MEAGDVIVVPFFPNQENKYSGEPRWILILECYDDSYRILPMTCQKHQSSRYKKTKTVLQNSTEGKRMGLACDALIICDRELDVSKTIMRNTFRNPGRCSDDFLDELFKLIDN